MAAWTGNRESVDQHHGPIYVSLYLITSSLIVPVLSIGFVVDLFVKPGFRQGPIDHVGNGRRVKSVQ